MPTISPFTPQIAKTVNIVPCAASANVLVTTNGASQIRVLNTTSVTAFIAFGASTVTASTTTDMPLFPAVGGGDYEVYTVPVAGSIYMAAANAVSASASATTLAIYATPGEGF